MSKNERKLYNGRKCIAENIRSLTILCAYEYKKIYSPYTENIQTSNCIYTVLKLFKAFKSGIYTVRMFSLTRMRVRS